MQTEHHEEYTLGQEVTEIALGKKAKETVVVSVRLPVDEFARLEKLSESLGKSMSQIIRDAVAAYQVPGHSTMMEFMMNMSDSQGNIFALGPVDYSRSSYHPVIEGNLRVNQDSIGLGRPLQERHNPSNRLQEQA